MALISHHRQLLDILKTIALCRAGMAGGDLTSEGGTALLKSAEKALKNFIKIAENLADKEESSIADMKHALEQETQTAIIFQPS